MSNNTHKLQKAFPVISVILAAILVFTVSQFADVKSDAYSTAESEGACVLEGTACQVFISDGLRIDVKVNQTITIEEAIDIEFTTSPGIEIESAWVEGVNMFMGKVPLLLEAVEPDTQKGWFMLGACSEPKMQWRMTINIKGRETPAFIWFSTQL